MTPKTHRKQSVVGINLSIKYNLVFYKSTVVPNFFILKPTNRSSWRRVRWLMGYFKVLAPKPDASESVLETCMMEIALKGHLISELVDLRSLRLFPGQSWLLRSSFQNSAEPNHPTLTQVLGYVHHLHMCTQVKVKATKQTENWASLCL